MQGLTREEQDVLIYLNCVLMDYKESVQRINSYPYFRHKICGQILKLHDLRLQMKMFHAFGLNAKVVDVRTVFLADDSLKPREYCDRLEKIVSKAGEADGLSGYSDIGIEMLKATTSLNVTAEYSPEDI
jgi:hypothetical protein